MTILTRGERYDLSTITMMGWTDGDGSGSEGYILADYFAATGEYLGADQHGIEPMVTPITPITPITPMV